VLFGFHFRKIKKRVKEKKSSNIRECLGKIPVTSSEKKQKKKKNEE
jgi:hypothetical protein